MVMANFVGDGGEQDGVGLIESHYVLRTPGLKRSVPFFKEC